MYPVSYCFIMVFNPSLLLNKIVILKSFNNTEEQLAGVSYLTDEMLSYRDIITTRQLSNCVRDVFAKRNNFSQIEMFCCELKFVVYICKKWTHEKFIRKNLSLDLSSKISYKNANKIDYNKPCVICGFDIGVAKEYGADSKKMSYYDFTIKKDHHFLRNIFSTEELVSSENMEDVKSYYKTFKKYMRIVTYLVTKKYSSETDIYTIDDPIMEDFLRKGGFDTFDELFFAISQHKVKNFTAKKAKLEQLKIISFVYQQIFDFPGRDEEIKAFDSKKFFDSVLNILYGDYVLHHSHIRGKIIG